MACQSTLAPMDAAPVNTSFDLHGTAVPLKAWVSINFIHITVGR